MKSLPIALTLVLSMATTPLRFSAAADAPPPWAYPVAAPGGAAPAPDDGSPKRVPGSAIGLTLAQTRDGFDVPDWHPDGHPAMPPIVARGRRPDVRGCGYCHLPNGFGRPENASLAGLPAAYIARQMADYKNDLRKSSEPKMGPPAAMLALAKAAGDDEVRVAAEYFASIRPTPWIRVVETATVPKTRVVGGMFVPADDGGTEPIGQRIVEVPEDRARTELRDAASGFIAYVPPGSLKKGEALVTTGDSGRTIRCGICHGDDLHGLGSVPAIAGRSPSYTGRQLWDLQHGARHGREADLMKATVAKLTEDDLIAIAAFTASRVP
ncbi:MAG: cytochrome C-binding protein [Acidobacteriia bacterium]|nr:cytochrome C-binding protein [Terriglobia bacterium]